MATAWNLRSLLKRSTGNPAEMLTQADAGTRIRGALPSILRGTQAKPFSHEDGGPSLEGTYRRLDDRGFLRVRTAQGCRRLLSGNCEAR